MSLSEDEVKYEEEEGEGDAIKLEVEQEDLDYLKKQKGNDEDENEETRPTEKEETQPTEKEETQPTEKEDTQATKIKEEANQANGNKTRDYENTPRDDEFSSENFKIELGGLPKYYPLGQLKKLINSVLQLDAHRVKPAGMGKNVAYVNFKDEAGRFKAITVLDGYKWMKASLTAQPADPAKDPMLLAKIDHLKVPKKEYEDLPLEERIMKAVIPLSDTPYEEQCKQKEKTVLQMMRKFGNELSQLNPELEEWVRFHKIRRKGQICEMDEIVPSPITEAYRNKCEFTIGKNAETSKPVCGFRMAKYKDGSVEVGPVEHLRHIQPKMKLLCKLMEKYLEDSSYEPFDPFSHKGVWRQLTVRTTNNGDCLIVVVIHPQDLDPETLQFLKDDSVAFFTDGDGAEAQVTSIYFQHYSQLESGVEVPLIHLWGKTCIEETILGKSFKASPESFLQVNTPACEELYKKITEVSDIDPTSVLLDICCGVGTIGISLADEAHKVFGVDIVDDAIENARLNADENGLVNCAFFSGRAEDYIDKMLERSEKMSTVAILDPPRAGLHGSVMNAIRKCDHIDRLVYVSCDPQGALPNFQALTRPKSKNYKGDFFVPIRAVPIDMFPDTAHVELVVVFERYDECKWRRIMDGNPRPKDQEYFNRVPKVDYTEKAKTKEDNEDGSRTRNRDFTRDRRRNRDHGYGNRRDRDEWEEFGPRSRKRRNFGDNTSWRSNRQSNRPYQGQYQVGGGYNHGGARYDNSNFQADTWTGGWDQGSSGWSHGNQGMNPGMWSSGFGSNMGMQGYSNPMANYAQGWNQGAGQNYGNDTSGAEGGTGLWFSGSGSGGGQG